MGEAQPEQQDEDDVATDKPPENVSDAILAVWPVEPLVHAIADICHQIGRVLGNQIVHHSDSKDNCAEQVDYKEVESYARAVSLAACNEEHASEDAGHDDTDQIKELDCCDKRQHLQNEDDDDTAEEAAPTAAGVLAFVVLANAAAHIFTIID